MRACRNSKNCPSGYECKDNIFGLKEGRCSPKRVRSDKNLSSKSKPKKSKSKPKKSKSKPKKSKSKPKKSKSKPKKSKSKSKKSKPKKASYLKQTVAGLRTLHRDLAQQQKSQKVTGNPDTDPDTVMFSNAWWHYLRENWWKILLKIILFLTVFFAIYGAVVPLINFQPWFSWWKTYGGNKLKTTNCFNMTSLAYAKGFSLYYKIGNLFGGIQQKLSLPKILILGSLMETYSIGMAKGGGRYMTPKSLCESIVPDEHIYPFNTKQILNCMGDLTDSGGVNKLSTYSTWPLGNDINTWKKIIEFWGGASICPSGAQVVTGPCAPTSPSSEHTYCAKNGSFTQNDRGNQNQWYSTGSKYLTSDGTLTNDPSQAASDSTTTSKKKLNSNYAGNFLWEIYGMPYDSMAIRAFLSGLANDWNQNPLYPSLLPAALGATSSFVQAGGWFGILQSASTGDDTGLSHTAFLRAFWAIDEPVNLPIAGGASSGSTKCNASDTVSAVTSAAGAAIGVGAMGMFCGPALAIPILGEIACGTVVAAAAIGAGTAAGIGSAANSNCL